MNWRSVVSSVDFVLTLCIIALGVFGVVMIFAATNAASTPAWVTAMDGRLWRNQLMFLVSGTAMMLVFAFIDYRWLSKFYLPVYGFMILLLVLVLIVGGDDGTGTARWFRFHLPVIGWVGIQPSEFAKIFLALFLARFLDDKQERFNFVGWLVVVGVSVGLPLTLVMMQNALSATLVIFFISVSIIFVAGLRYKTMLLMLLVLVPIGIVVWVDLHREVHWFVDRILQPYQLLRITTALDPYNANPDALWQQERSLYAIGTGGLTGNGFMAHPHMTLGHNDFVFSVIASQFGFVGAVAVLAVLILIIVKCILVALRAEDMTGKLFATGMAGMLLFETFVHVGVGIGLLPVTGMPLPFISSGGSMIWGHMLGMGIVLNIGMPRKKSMFEVNL